ncbi:MAG TPA: alpha/beta hydrolase [Candidatus Korarchaeota archaeon]|nr:alpha/beta hydrolase [Candidatus Korarchaeota archaeon]
MSLSESARSKSFVTSDGVRISFAEFGAGEALILIHGWAASRLFWKHQIPELAERYRVVALDLRGHGDSEKPLPADYTARRMARDVVELCLHLGIRDPAIVGHSFGSIVASLAALEVGCRSLILLSPPLRMPTKPEIALMRFLLAIRPLSRKTITPKMFAQPTTELMEFVRRESAKAPPAALMEVLLQNSGSRLPSHLPPDRTTIIVGSADRINDPAKLERFSRLVGARFILIPGAGHDLMLERPEEVTKAMIEVLS